MTPDVLAKEIRSLVQRLRPWTPSRWEAAADPWGSRADLVRHLAQCLADSTADIESRPRRQLPALSPQLLLADQLAVTGDDLVRSGPDARMCEDAVAHLLAHRFDLLDEPAPESLGGPAALERGRTVCAS